MCGNSCAVCQWPSLCLGVSQRRRPARAEPGAVGHNFGAPHTHESCGMEDDPLPVDGCYRYPENTPCYMPGVYRSVEGGGGRIALMDVFAQRACLRRACGRGLQRQCFLCSVGSLEIYCMAVDCCSAPLFHGLRSDVHEAGRSGIHYRPTAHLHSHSYSLALGSRHVDVIFKFAPALRCC